MSTIVNATPSLVPAATRTCKHIDLTRFCAGKRYICGSIVGPSTQSSAKSGSFGEETRRTALTHEDFPTPACSQLQAPDLGKATKVGA